MASVLQFTDVTVVRDGNPILKSANWTVDAADRWVVLGPNGAGKITLLQVAAAAVTTLATNQAVRDGARAMSLGRSVPVAVDASLPGNMQAESITYPAGGVRIEVPVLRIGIFPSFTVVREAAMPRMVP